MTVQTRFFKYILLSNVVIFGALGVCSGTDIENPILSLIYVLGMMAGAVATGIYINNTFKVVK